MSYRPHIINQFAEIIGFDFADKIARDFAGTRLHISVNKNSKLVKSVGVEAATLLQQHFGNMTIEIPLGQNALFVSKKRTFYDLLNAGYSVQKAQLTVGICPRTAWYWKKQYTTDPDEPPQPNHPEF